MNRNILDEAHIHPAMRDAIAANQADIAREVKDAVAANGSLGSCVRVIRFATCNVADSEGSKGSTQRRRP